MKFVNRPNSLTIMRKPGRNGFSGLLLHENRTIPCSLGKSGIYPIKLEGDGVTPAGKFELLYGYYRKDRVKLPASNFPFHPISSSDGWCDDPNNAGYNQPVKLPFNASHEKMCRENHLYDICIVLNYNIWPIARNRGSAIFFHLTSEDKGPTHGCVAIEKLEMLKLIPYLRPGMVMDIKA